MERFTIKQREELLPFLQRTYSGMSRTRVKEMLSLRRIEVDGHTVTRHNFALEPGMTVTIAPRENHATLRSAYVKPVYEDRWLIVVEKRPGILSMGTPHHAYSVKTVLDDYFAHRHQSVRAHVVHRLDRDTSGLLVYAKTREVQHIFEADWHERVSDRRYYAIAEGWLEPPRGTAHSWLKDNKAFFTYSSPTDNGGREAITHYATLARTERYSLVELKLETGRKNQIRVHLADLGHPVVGDAKYGSREDPVGRLCLHAFRLNFKHPITGEEMKFETPYPREFEKLVPLSKSMQTEDLFK